MKKTLVIVIFITICCIIFSCTDSNSPNGSGGQEPPAILWTQYYGSPQSGYGEEVLQTNDGGFLLLGSNQISEGYETWLLKTDQNGDSLWKHTFDLGSSAHGYSIQHTLDDGYVITGQYDLYGNWSDIFLLKTDGFGNELWHQVYAEGDSAGTQGEDVLVTPDGGYLIAATYHYSPFNIEHIFATWLLKTDDSGDSLWCQIFEDRLAYSILQASDGNYVVAGTSMPEYSDFWLMKTDPDGEQLWSQTYHVDVTNCAFSVEEADDGGYIVSGYCGDFSNMVYFCLLKTDADGNEIWHRTFSELDANIGICARPTSDGGIIFAGHTGTTFSAGDYDIMVIKTNAMGFEQWRKIMDLDVNNAAGCILETVDGGYIISGLAGGMAMLVMLDGE